MVTVGLRHQWARERQSHRTVCLVCRQSYTDYELRVLPRQRIAEIEQGFCFGPPAEQRTG